jgi:hypothetical protein
VLLECGDIVSQTGESAMKNLWQSLFAVCVAATALGISGPGWAASASGPYYATPSWDQKLDASTRFVVLSNWNNEAVLDRETGLVWEQSPLATPVNWVVASSNCFDISTTGNRKGWRLPTIQELMSLFDPSANSLPTGHPFSNIHIAEYWSSTGLATSAGFRLVLDFATGFAAALNQLPPVSAFVWCVRGGSGIEAQ